MHGLVAELRANLSEGGGMQAGEAREKGLGQISLFWALVGPGQSKGRCRLCRPLPNKEGTRFGSLP